MRKKQKFNLFWLIIILILAFIVPIAHYKEIKKSSTPLKHHFISYKTIPDIDYSINYKILFVGDTMLARTIGNKIVNGVNPFTKVENIFQQHDIIIANIETNISEESIGVKARKLYTFKAPLEALSSIKISGIDICILANNHTMDYGPDALVDMIKRINSLDMKTVGAGGNNEESFKPLIINIPFSNPNIPTLDMAIIAINDRENYVTKSTDITPGSAYFNKEKIIYSINKAHKEGADIIIIIPHWGEEYKEAQNQRQIEWAHFFIDNGADIVVGGHPHVIQPSELYQGKMIYYSLGNFVFDQMNTTKGQILSITITAKYNIKNGQFQTNISDQKLIDIFLDSHGFPYLNNKQNNQ